MKLGDFRLETEPGAPEQEDYDVMIDGEDTPSGPYPIAEIYWDHNENRVVIIAQDQTS